MPARYRQETGARDAEFVAEEVPEDGAGELPAIGDADEVPEEEDAGELPAFGEAVEVDAEGVPEEEDAGEVPAIGDVAGVDTEEVPEDGAGNGEDNILNAQWGGMKGIEIRDSVTKAYEQVSRWKRNLFYLPTGKAGESFIEELTKVINQFNNDSAFESVSLMMVTLMFPLLLQKPSQNSKTKDHVRYLEKRMEMWKNGQLAELISEGKAIQNRISRKKKSSSAKKEKRFISLMEEGKVSAALRCIGSLESGVLDITPEVLDDLKKKHPESKEAEVGSVIQGPLPERSVEEVVYENIDAEAIYKAAKKVNGAAGPSGADSDLWKRLLCSKQYKKKPANLCQAVADLGKKLNKKYIASSYLQAFVASRLVPLDKKPGVRPIGIGEVLRRIVCSATVSLLKPELVAATAPLQTCAGIAGGIEASIHAMRRMYEDNNTEGILLVDASNAFNALNRKAALHNIQYTCPELSTFVRNLYQCDAELFLSNSEEVIYSREGTTQGGPESMGLYAASMTKLSEASSGGGMKKVFYADDGSGAGSLDELSEWWQDLQVHGPLLGYYPNAPKTWLIVKPDHLDRAQELFPGINVTTDGHRYLGSFIGTAEATKAFVEEEIAKWEKDVDALAKIAESEPQLAYSAYVYGTSRRWQFVCRTTPGISEAMQSLEDLIRTNLIPAIMGGRDISDELRMILNLPARMGGMGFLNPSDEADWEYENSKHVTSQLTEAIYHQKSRLLIDEEAQGKVMKDLRKRKEERWTERQEYVKNTLDEKMQRIVMLSAEKGASTWLTSLPLKSYGFRLNKQHFQDALCMRYDLKLKDVPNKCACGQPYTINHCLSCKRGGYVHIRHNAVRDTVSEILKEVCKDVRVEPQLLPVTGEVLPAGTNVADGARSDVSAVGLWQPLNRAFLDIRVFNPLAPSNSVKQIDKMYRHHEQSKKREYNARIIEVEKGTFTPVVFSCSGGASQEASRLLKAMALKLSVKRREKYSDVINFVRRRIRFDVLRTCLISFRGDRGTDHSTDAINELDIGIQEMEVY